MSHTDWPALSDISAIALGMGVSLPTSVLGTAIQQSVLDSVIENITRKTHRTWVVTSAERYYDGNNTGQIEVDEFVSLTSVELIGWFGISTGLSLSNVIAIERPTFPNTKIQIYRGSLPALYRVWVDRFPSGRSNIKTVASWGYATTIPADLWLGVAYQAAGILINWKLFKTDGFLIKWTEADVTQVQNYMDPFKYFASGMTYKGLIKMYKKPAQYFQAKQQRVLM